MAHSIDDGDRKWWEHANFWFRYFDTIPMSEAEKIVRRFEKQLQAYKGAKDTTPLYVGFAFFASWIFYVADRSKAEKEGTFHPKLPLPESELPPSVQKPIPCALGCGRTFHRNELGSSSKVTSHGVEPEWSPWSVLYTDEDGIKREYARVRCWECDDTYYPPKWVRDRIRKSVDADSEADDDDG